MANHQSLPQHGKPSPTLSLMLKEFTEKNLRRPRHILGIDSGVQSHTKATPRLHQGYTKATPRPHQSHTKATPKPHQSHTKANYSGYFKGWRARKPPVLPGSWP